MLLPEDERYLNEKGVVFEFHQSGSTGHLIIKDYLLPAGFTPEKTDLLLEIPAGYPDAGLDMFWVRPPVKIAATNAEPVATNAREPKTAGEPWQRFSRHGYPWKSGDSIASYLIWVRRNLEHDVGALPG